MIVSAWGKEGSGKSTFGLTYPYPLFHQELDLGGFERAIWRIERDNPALRVKRCNVKESISDIDWGKWDIVTKPYPVPIQMDKLIGAQEIKQGNTITIRFPRRVIGYKELWEEIIVDFVAVCQVPVLKSIMPDSATQLWTICHQGHLQDKQEIQLSTGMKENDSKFREKLQPVEFPNEKMRSLIYTAKSFGKHLIMTHYEGDVYANKVTDKGVESYKTGELVPDGFKHTTEIDDIVIFTYVEQNQPRAKVTIKCGLPGMGMTAVGLELPSPSYQGLMELQEMLRGG